MNPQPSSSNFNLSNYAFSKERQSNSRSKPTLNPPSDLNKGFPLFGNASFKNQQTENHLSAKGSNLLNEVQPLTTRNQNFPQNINVEGFTKESDKGNDQFHSPHLRKQKKIRGHVSSAVETNKTLNHTSDYISKNHEKLVNSEATKKVNSFQTNAESFAQDHLSRQDHPSKSQSFIKPSEAHRNSSSATEPLIPLFENQGLANQENQKEESKVQEQFEDLNVLDEHGKLGIMKGIEGENSLNNSGFGHKDDANVPPFQTSRKTKDLLDGFYQVLDKLPGKTQEKLQSFKSPDVWNLGFDETLDFFRKLPSTEMDTEEYMNEDHNIQPQELDIPNDIIEDFKRNIDVLTTNLHRNLKEIHELFMFSQKVEKTFGDKENQNIHRKKEISGAFSGLSHYIWDYLQNQFNFTDANFSQESSFNFQDVAEKVNTQKFLSELNDDPLLDDLLNYFNGLMMEQSRQELSDQLAKNAQELVNYDILDDELALYLFGDSFNLDNSNVGIDLSFPNSEQNLAEQEFKNQFMAISQDLKNITNGKMDEENKVNNCSSAKDSRSDENDKGETQNMSEEIRIEESSPMLQVKPLQQRGAQGLQQTDRSSLTPANTTQMTVTQPSEMNTYQQQCMDFEEGFMPMEFDEESNYMTGFTFLGGEGFVMNGLENTNGLEDE